MGRGVDRAHLARGPEQGLALQHGQGAGGEPGFHAIGPAGEDDGHAGADDQPGDGRAAEVFELLGQHIARLQIGREQNVGQTGYRRVDAFGLGGGQRQRVVEGQRPVENGAGDLPAVGHFAQCGGVQRGGHIGIDGLHRGENGHAWRFDAQRLRQFDGVLRDVALGVEIRSDVDRCVGDEQQPVGRRGVDDEHMAGATAGAQAGLGVEGGVHQFVGVQRAFHQRADLAAACQFDRQRGGGVAVLGGHELPGREVDARGLCRRADTGFRADPHGFDQPGLGGVDRALDGDCVHRMHHGHAHGFEALAALARFAHQREQTLARIDQMQLRQMGARAADFLRGRLHQCLPGGDGFAALVDHLAVEADLVALGQFFACGHRGGHGVAQHHRVVERQRLIDVHRARPRQFGAEQVGQQHAAPHAVRHHLVKRRAAGKLLIDVRGVGIARHHGKSGNVGPGEGALQGGGVAQGDFVEGAVADRVGHE